jgi:putative DNA primase/helicase
VQPSKLDGKSPTLSYQGGEPSKQAGNAIAYARRGYKVFPCHEIEGDGECSCGKRQCGSAGKHPRISAWPEQATSEEHTIREWWTQWPSANVGVTCGAASNLLALDVDVKNGHDGVNTLRDLELEHSELPSGPIVLTPTGGRHYMFAHEPGIRNVAGFADGLDVRTEGGFVVGVGSRTKAGVYLFDQAFKLGDDLMPPRAPAWLTDLMRAAHSNGQGRFKLDKGPILKGQRNDTLFRLGRSMRARKLSERAIEAAINAENTARCVPPLDLRELDQIIQQVFGQPDTDDFGANGGRHGDGADRGAPDSTRALSALRIVRDAAAIKPVDIRPPGFSDDATAERFADRFSPTFRYVARWNQWLKYNGASWGEEDTLQAFDLARTICREVAAGLPKVHERIAANIASAKTVAAVERLARSDRRHAAVIDQWDGDPMLLNTPAGTINLMTGELRANRSEDYCTKITAVGPAEHADCPLWQYFLDHIFAGDDELIAYMKRLAGYVLTGLTIEQHFNFFYGPGANGKGVLMNTQLGILGNYATSTPTETFMASKTDRHPTELADLRGARLVTASETEKGRRWAETRLKNITGGDPIKARFMRGDFFEYIPQFKLLLAGNQKPRLSAVDEAIRRRIHLVPFMVIIPPEQRDKHLAEKLKGEWPAILRWMIEGCLEWQAEGLNPPSTVRDATEAYLDAEDLIGEWIGRECEQGKSYETTIKALFKSWKQFAEAADEFVGSSRAMAEELEKRGYQRHRIGNARDKGFLGLKLKEFPA